MTLQRPTPAVTGKPQFVGLVATNRAISRSYLLHPQYNLEEELLH